MQRLRVTRKGWRIRRSSAQAVFEAGGKARAMYEVVSVVHLIHFLLVQKTNQKRTLFIRNFYCVEPSLKLRVTTFLNLEAFKNLFFIKRKLTKLVSEVLGIV